MLELGLECAEGCDIIGRDLDLGLLPGVQEGDVGGLGARLYQKGVVERDDLDQTRPGWTTTLRTNVGL